jgi:hypothetical protein
MMCDSNNWCVDGGKVLMQEKAKSKSKSKLHSKHNRHGKGHAKHSTSSGTSDEELVSYPGDATMLPKYYGSQFVKDPAMQRFISERLTSTLFQLRANALMFAANQARVQA